MKTTLFFFIGIIIFTTSCSTYTMPIESLTEQLKSSTPKQVSVRGFVSGTYLSNGIEEISCLKGAGKATLTNSPSIEMRITTTRKKWYGYFDTIMLEGDNIAFSRSRIFEHIDARVPIVDIVKIEIQDGKKRIRYVD